MDKALLKKQIFTIPNILSMVRILILPFIVYFYVVKDDSTNAILLLFLSGISDILDGFIARKFNMVSDFGKLLDPVADKLTQGILLICLAIEYDIIFILVGMFAVKEALMLIMGCLIFKNHGSVNSAKWYGKVNTVVIYSTIVIMLFFPHLPKTTVNILIFACMFFLVASFILYTKFYIKILKKESSN